jgi:CheY-like chemotaxis protein
MAASSRFKIEQPIAHDRDELLVVLVGLQHLVGSKGDGIFERCQLRVVEVPNPEDACRVLETISPDAIVLDSHHSELKRMAGAAVRLLRLLRAHDPNKRHIPMVVLTSAGISVDLRRAFVNIGALMVPAHLQTHRQLAALIRRLCGLTEPCCEIDPLLL